MIGAPTAIGAAGSLRIVVGTGSPIIAGAGHPFTTGGGSIIPRGDGAGGLTRSGHLPGYPGVIPTPTAAGRRCRPARIIIQALGSPTTAPMWASVSASDSTATPGHLC